MPTLTKIETTAYRWSTWKSESPEDFDRVYLGDFEPVRGTPEPTDWLWIDLMGGSDYSGDSVNVSNRRVFLDRFKETDGVKDVYGGHGTYGVMVRRNVLESNTEIQEALAPLANHPVLDDDDLSQVELDAEGEAWESWAASDFKRALVKRFPAMEDVLEELTDHALSNIFEPARDRANVYWENETGNSAHIDIDRVAKEVTEDEIRRVGEAF